MLLGGYWKQKREPEDAAHEVMNIPGMRGGSEVAPTSDDVHIQA